MGKRKLISGVLIGAVVGGLAALLDRSTREYATTKLHEVKESTSRYTSNPHEAIRDARIAFDKFNQGFSGGAEKAMESLEKLEQTMSKVSQRASQIEEK